MTHAIEATGLVVEHGARRVLDQASLRVERGAWCVVVGPSGSGKTTLLRAIVGLQPLVAGRIELCGRLASDGTRLVLPPERRGVGLVFQGGGGGLWPHLSAQATIEFVLARRGTPRRQRAAGARRWLELVELGPLAARKPGELSGGEAQRLALARALAGEPSVLLLDEPLGPLDAPLRAELVSRLESLRRASELTLVHVTHDPAEVAANCTALVRLERGAVVAA
jgi:iron(III) transport system ATP-binding protein